MPDLKMAALIATALLGSTTMIGTAAAMPSNALPEAASRSALTSRMLAISPTTGGGWRRWGPWGWRHRWSGAKQGAKDR
jgi:hypothetical protein